MLFTLSVSFIAMYSYTHGPLRGDFNKHIMAAKKFGIPHELQEKGISPLYTDDINSGWDGQFYYYISNDLLAQKDTKQHIDADAYRYQRIGLPMLAKLASFIFLQNWVSPLSYYLTHLTLILFATLLGANFFLKHNFAPEWILLWSVGIGTQLTLLNGLPDAAADALLIIALISLFNKRYFSYSLAITFAALSREVYIIFPILFLYFVILLHCKKINDFCNKADLVILISPIIYFALWRFFLYMKFSTSPSSQAFGILGLPFYSTMEYLFAGIRGEYPGLRIGKESYVAGLNILTYILLLSLTMFTFLKLRPKNTISTDSIFHHVFNHSFIALILLYTCFGDTVMFNYTGFMKAATIFMFAIPFLHAISNSKPSLIILCFLLFILALFNYQGWRGRIHQPVTIPTESQNFIFYKDSQASNKDVYYVK